MFDSANPDTFPDNPQAVAGYVSEAAYRPPDFEQVRTRFPHALHLSIATFANYDADCLDIEQSDATIAEAPAWVRRQQQRGIKRPCVYANLSTMPSVVSALNAAGIVRSEVRLWIAHYTDRAHLCSPACGSGFQGYADATQWTET